MVFSRLRRFCCCSLCSCFLPPDGVERAAWAQFIGRFHLLTVHFPIALILLVPVLELAGRIRRFPDLRASVDFLLALAILSSLVAATLGWCLARSGGYSGRLVTQHMWGGVSRRSRLLALLDVARTLPRPAFGFHLPLRACGRCRACILDWISRRPAIARRKSPDRTHAGRAAQLIGTLGQEATSYRADRILLLFMARMWNPFSLATATPATVRISRKSRLRLDTYDVAHAGRQAWPRHQGGKRQRQRAFSPRYALPLRR